MLVTIAGIIGGLLAFLAFVPLVRVGWWAIRILDFPRTQLAVVGVVPVGLLALSPPWGAWHWAILALVVATAAWQLAHTIPFSPVWRTELDDVRTPEAAALRACISNVRCDNDQREDAVRVLSELDTDVMLLIEPDEAWERDLGPVFDRYPHRLSEIRGDGLGLCLLSKLPFRDAEIRHLVSRARPSLHLTLTLPDGRDAHVVGVHPTPPGLKRDEDEQRHDSRIRDAELVVLAREIADTNGDTPWIILGDLNDVAWSHTTRLFKRLSGLKDPRVGRGLVNSYHAQRPLWRYPIDHLFASPAFGVADLQRLTLPGSDHFILLATLGLARGPATDPDHDSRDRAEATGLAREGVLDTDAPAR